MTTHQEAQETSHSAASTLERAVAVHLTKDLAVSHLQREAV